MNKENLYVPEPLFLDDVELPSDLEDLTELIAENVHEVWAQTKLEQGWRYGDSIDENAKSHSRLIPYNQLKEEDKVYDRDTAMNTLKLILKLGYKISK